MSKKLIYTLTSIICLTLIFVGQLLHERLQVAIKQSGNAKSETKTVKVETTPKGAPKERVVRQVIPPKKTEHKKEDLPKKKIVIRSAQNLVLTQSSFEELPGWDEANMKKSLLAFQVSCETFLKQKPSRAIGSQHIKLKVGDWHPACKAALAIESVSEESAKAFFEKWFHPLEIGQKKPVHGIFTGYYMPKIEGSLERSSKYSTPIYGLPKGRHSTYYTREQIDNGALKKKAPVIAWIHSPVERLFLEIEGSGVIHLSNGKSIYLGYAGENGAPYTSIGKVLINQGIMTRHNASKAAIIRYLETHPEKANTILHKNKSFVFFEDMKKPMALGAQGMALTPGYSLAVDKKWIPLGAPLWLDTKRPKMQKSGEKKFQRLMIAQDTGGAIRGLVRGDIYWGSGRLATFLGEHMKNRGHYWLLLPKHILNRLAK